MASGDWGLTVTKGKGRFNSTVLWVLQGQQGRCMLLKTDGLTFSACPMVGHSLGKSWVKYLRRSEREKSGVG